MRFARRYLVLGAVLASAACAPTGPATSPRAAHDVDQQNVAAMPHSDGVSQGTAVPGRQGADGAARGAYTGAGTGDLGGASDRARRSPRDAGGGG